MLVLLGFLMIAVFMVLIMTKRLTPPLALIIVPTVFGLFAGAGLGLGDMVMDAVKSMSSTAALLMFAIIYFGLMVDVGLFDKLVTFILKIAGRDPVKVVMGTAVLAAAVSLDGDGSTTFIIVTAAMLPVYQRMQLSPVVLTCVAGLANGTMNIVPWGGPTARAAAALHVDASAIFVPMLPSLGIGMIVVLVFAWQLGRLERRRLEKAGALQWDRTGAVPDFVADAAVTGGSRAKSAKGTQAKRTTSGASSQPLAGSGGASTASPDAEAGEAAERELATVGGGAGSGGRANRLRVGGTEFKRDDSRDAAEADYADGAGGSLTATALDPNRPTLRPKLLWFNLGLTLIIMVLLVLDQIPLPYLFMVGSALALLVNFPKVGDQAKMLASHADAIIAVVSMVMAAAVLTGVLTGTGMVEAMSQWLVDVIPASWGPFMAVITGLISIPATFLMSNDAFYFGILPVLSETAAHYGIPAVDMARASITGQPVHLQSPLVPAILLLVSLAGVNLGDHHKKVLWRALVVSLVMLTVGVLVGAIGFGTR
ncbi:MAG: citrate:proton symporter [Arthrobacter sp.]|jgi:CitMHS family citrate-Mg2+:H+ or citrate-Ca2+:H+ symporter|nr:citrate:proton symporter [Arthrobacter sp.]